MAIDKVRKHVKRQVKSAATEAWTWGSREMMAILLLVPERRPALIAARPRGVRTPRRG